MPRCRWARSEGNGRLLLCVEELGGPGMVMDSMAMEPRSNGNNIWRFPYMSWGKTMVKIMVKIMVHSG